MKEFNLLASGDLITVKQSSKNTVTFNKDTELFILLKKNMEATNIHINVFLNN